MCCVRKCLLRLRYEPGSSQDHGLIIVKTTIFLMFFTSMVAVIVKTVQERLVH